MRDKRITTLRQGDKPRKRKKHHVAGEGEIEIRKRERKDHVSPSDEEGMEEDSDQGEEELEVEVHDDYDTSDIQKHDFAIVEEKGLKRKVTAKRELYLARVLDPTPPITLHLWIINTKKKITPTFRNAKNKEWYRKTEESRDPPNSGFKPWDIDTRDWNILASSPTVSDEMTSLLNESCGPFSFYDD